MKFPKSKVEKHENHKIPCKNLEKKKKRDNHYEKNRIPIDNNGNRENIVITYENYASHENDAIQQENN